MNDHGKSILNDSRFGQDSFRFLDGKCPSSSSIRDLFGQRVVNYLMKFFLYYFPINV